MINRIILLALVLSLTFAEKCGIPPTAPDYKQTAYLGKWYQMGKYQTAGGAFFEKDCFCTQSDIIQQSGKTLALQSCVKNGKRTGINATLIPLDNKGRYVQQFSSFNKGYYYVIYLDDDYAIEYDCNQQLGVTNYCVHIMSRHLTIPQDKLNELKTYSLGLGLNPRNLPFQRTEQFTCRNTFKSNLDTE